MLEHQKHSCPRTRIPVGGWHREFWGPKCPVCSLGPVRPGYVVAADFGQNGGEQIRRETELRRTGGKAAGYGRNGQKPLAVVTRKDVFGKGMRP
jgi:hypothetical protein